METEIGFVSAEKTLSLWELFGRIIHSTEYEIYANDYHIKSRFGLIDRDILKHHEASSNAKHFKPVCSISTDRVPLLMFEIAEFARSTLTYLEAAADHLIDEIGLGPYGDQQ